MEHAFFAVISTALLASLTSFAVLAEIAILRSALMEFAWFAPPTASNAIVIVLAANVLIHTLYPITHVTLTAIFLTA